MTAPIGHNNPPCPFAAMAAHINDLYELAEGALTGGEITTPERAGKIEELKNDLKKAVADAEKARKIEKEPHLEAGRVIDAKWKELTEKGTLAVKTANTALTPFLQKVQAEKDADKERLRKEAEAKAAEALQAFTTTAPTDLEARANAEQLAKEATKATATANKIDRSATGLRTTYRAEIVDYFKFGKWAWKNRNAEYAQFLESLAASEARGNRGQIPGLEIHIQKIAT